MPATTAQNTGQALNSNYILPPPAKNNPGQAGARAHFVNANLAQTAANGVRINIATPQSLDSELEDLQSDGAVRKKKKVPVRKSKQSKRDMDAKERGIATFKRNLLWLIVLFAYSFIGGVTFSAIEGGKEKIERLQKYEKEKDIYEKRRIYQDQIVEKFQEINSDDSFTSVGLLEFNELSNISSGTHTKKELMRDILDWYEKKLGIEIKEPVMEDTKWTIWGGIYYSASLYTTIGYGNFHPNTRAGQIISMAYAFCGIPLVFTILLEWGFLYFTWIEIFWKWVNGQFFHSSMQAHLQRRLKKEKFRKAGSDLSLRLTSIEPMISVARKDIKDQSDRQTEVGKRIAQLEVQLSDAEKQRTVPLKAALIFFFAWLLISAFIVRFWERNWSYFTAYYFFFNSLTTIGLGDVVPETPNYIVFNLAMTLIGLSVVGLCVAIVQAKIRLVFDRTIRSIDGQYRIRQIDPDVATMTVISDEKEGIKRLCEAQPLQDRIIFLAMDEHKKQLLEDRWRQRSQMVNKTTQTYPSKADKCIQTGHRVDDQPPPEPVEGDEDNFDPNDPNRIEGSIGKKVIPPNTQRYIYTIFD